MVNMVVCEPCSGVFTKMKKMGSKSNAKYFFHPVIEYLANYVFTTPGCRDTVMPFP